MRERRSFIRKVKMVLSAVVLGSLLILWNVYSNDEKDTVKAGSTAEESVPESHSSENSVESLEEVEQVVADTVATEVKKDTKAGGTLAAKMAELDAQYPGTVGFTLLNKSTDELIAVNPDYVFTSASVYKLYVTYAILTGIDHNRFTLNTVMNEQTNATVDDYLRDTITLSANNTAIALADRMGWRVIEDFVQESGFTETTFNTTIQNGVAVRGKLHTTPANVTDFLNRLMEGELLSEESTDYFMGLLADQQLVYALNTGLTDEVEFAHKTGILDYVSHDAGIITDAHGNEYIVVVMSDGWSYAYEEATPMFMQSGEYIMDYLHTQS